MDFELPDHVIEFRTKVRRIISETVTEEMRLESHKSGFFNSYALNQRFAAEGILETAVPGMGKGDPLSLWVFFNELEHAQAPYDGISVALLVAAVVNAMGTDEQKERILPSILSGTALVSLGYSEPDYGSDVASIVTRAVQDGDEWVINGAKMWTSLAQESKWILLLTRTNPDVPKHKGLTMFILPMNTPGITHKPVPTMGAEITNATFYDNVRVGSEAILGEVNDGWRAMGVALAFERGVMGGTAAGVPLLHHFFEWGKHALGSDGPVSADPIARERMARTAIDNEVAKLLTQQAAWIAATGGLPGLEGSMAKIFATEAYQKACRWFQQLAGPAGILQFHQPGAAAHGWIEYENRHAPVTTIYGGTSEINRNNVAERLLGLPKAR